MPRLESGLPAVEREMGSAGSRSCSGSVLVAVSGRSMDAPSRPRGLGARPPDASRCFSASASVSIGVRNSEMEGESSESCTDGLTGRMIGDRLAEEAMELRWP